MFEAVIDYIARTNLFNFIIFAGIIIYLFIKLDVIGRLNSGAKEVVDKIDKSETAKDESEIKLKSIEESVANLEKEVEGIIKQSEANAEVVGGQILAGADKSAENIKANALKLIENKTGVLKNDIMRRASLASVEIAKGQIIKELENNDVLHNRLIDESIEAINGVDL